MEYIFHEKQEGRLCAQHCLNSLLQAPFYTPVDLASIAQELDEEERRRMAGGATGENSEEYRRFVSQPSSNMDDTGFFSLQVIAKAVKVWGLDIVSYMSSDAVAVAAKANPTSQTAFICNYREHWFAIRKLGNQWFNLNSLLTGPELISDTFLGLFLAQLETEGYTIYVVNGELPNCQADQVLHLMPAVQTSPPKLLSAESVGGAERASTASLMSQQGVKPKLTGLAEDPELQAAMAKSLQERPNPSGFEDEEFKAALRLSKSTGSQDSAARKSVEPSSSDTESEKDQIQKAIALSLESNELVKRSEDELQAALARSLKVPSASVASSLKDSTQLAKSVADDAQQSVSTAKLPTSGPKPTNAPAAAATSTSRPPATRPGPVTMPGEGTSLSGTKTRAKQSTPDPEEVRKRRLQFLDKKQKQ